MILFRTVWAERKRVILPASGRERPLYRDLSHDQQEAWAIFGMYPGYAWLPDGSGFVLWAQGKLKRVDAKTGEARDIPFRAQVRQTVTEAVRFSRRPLVEKALAAKRRCE